MSQVVVPDIGDFKEVEVIEVLVKPGDSVSKEQSLITLESDKATMEIPSPAAGVVKALKVKTGDKVSRGTLSLELGGKEEAAKPARKEEPKREDPKQEAKSAAGGPMTVPVPDIGDFKEVEVIEVLVKPGDKVSKEQSLITLESDKATMEIPSPGAGTVKELKVKVGDKVSKGSPILMLEGSEAPKTESAAKPVPPPPAAPSPLDRGATQKPSSEYDCDVLVIAAAPGGYSAALPPPPLPPQTPLAA